MECFGNICALIFSYCYHNIPIIVLKYSRNDRNTICLRRSQISPLQKHRKMSCINLFIGYLLNHIVKSLSAASEIKKCVYVSRIPRPQVFIALWNTFLFTSNCRSLSSNDDDLENAGDNSSSLDFKGRFCIAERLIGRHSWPSHEPLRMISLLFARRIIFAPLTDDVVWLHGGQAQSSATVALLWNSMLDSGSWGLVFCNKLFFITFCKQSQQK